MFHLLDSYADQDFYDAHPIWYFLTPEAAYQVELFSGYETASTSSVYQLDFPEEDEWLTYLSEAQENSLFSSSVSVTPEDQVLTLSTCAYSFQNARFVLQGVLRKI